MPHSLKELTDEALQLAPNERIILAESLLLTIDEGHDGIVDEAVFNELERRLEDLKSGRVPGIPAEDVLREVRESLKSTA